MRKKEFEFDLSESMFAMEAGRKIHESIKNCIKNKSTLGATTILEYQGKKIRVKIEEVE